MTDTLTAATARLHSERLALADAKALANRVAARVRDIDAAAAAAADAAIAAAASPSPDDDADALRALSEARTRRDTTRQAYERATADVDARTRRVALAEKAIIMAIAAAELDEARGYACELDTALGSLLALCSQMTAAVSSARQRVNASGSAGPDGLQIDLYLGRRLRLALIAAGINVGEASEGPRPDRPQDVSKLVGAVIDSGRQYVSAHTPSPARIDAQLAA